MILRMVQDVITLNLGDLPTRFFFIQSGVAAQVARHYEKFLAAEAGRLAWRLQVSVAPQMISVEGFPYQPVQMELERQQLKFLRPDFQADIDLQTGRGTLLYAGDIPSLDTFLRALYSFRLLEVQGLLVHASSIEFAGSAHLFVGRSGAGKSTIARLSGARILTDEISLLRSEDSQFCLYGTPFWGELRGGGEAVHFPLRSMNFLRKDGATFVERVRLADAVRKLLRCTLFFGARREWRQQLLAIAESVCAATCCQDLHFRQDNQFLGLIDARETLKN